MHSSKCTSTSVLLLFYLSVIKSASIKRDEVKSCRKVPPAVLAYVLGSAFNPRYMSIQLPSSDKNGIHDDGHKRKVEPQLPFYVEEDFNQQLSDLPAWKVNPAVLHLYTDTRTSRHKRTPEEKAGLPFDPEELEETFNDVEDYSESEGIFGGVEDYSYNGETVLQKDRRKRLSLKPVGHQWKCEAKVKWLDLGEDYFPRFLRTVDCSYSSCWYGRYKCRPRAFTVRLLKRRTDSCDEFDLGHKIGVEGLPPELRELWVWEERAINFCCDCSLK